MAEEEFRFRAAHLRFRARILLRRNTLGRWSGRLSASALSTAVAAFALESVNDQESRRLALRGRHWLCLHQNHDGGWGDTDRSPSNLSTTLLVWAALAGESTESAAGVEGDFDLPFVLSRAEGWIGRMAGSLAPADIADAVRARYGSDLTFSVPILTTLALSGRLGGEGWRLVPPLPFELAILPVKWLKRFRLGVVSYALPALIAMGAVRHRLHPDAHWFLRILRGYLLPRLMKRLGRLQPPNGGFLEAIPLTSFVVMSLLAAGESNHEVVRRGVGFLRATCREDGSWPIDTTLSTWVTTHAIPLVNTSLLPAEREGLRCWLHSSQHREIHPFTGAAPGGWAWTDEPGGVPDADDTAAALKAMALLAPEPGEEDESTVLRGVNRLLDLQNPDGGVPTFCRGWGRLPFDQSAPEITASVISAWSLWQERMPGRLRKRTEPALAAAVDYLKRVRAADGSWRPLWFGCEAGENHANTVYGTAVVVAALAAVKGGPSTSELVQSGARFLLTAQNPDGGWGGRPTLPSTPEETAKAVTALLAAGGEEANSSAILGGVWLITWEERTDLTAGPASPIGLYFASLWYYEELYPLLFITEALEALARVAETEEGRSVR